MESFASLARAPLWAVTLGYRQVKTEDGEAYV